MKKTAVDWIVKQLDVLNRERKDKLIDAETYFKNKIDLIDQAKEMEKEQTVEFANYCVELQYKSFKTGEGIDVESMEELLEIFKNK